MPFNEIGIKKIAAPVIILISILFLTSGILSGCAYKREALTKTFALKLIRQKIEISPFFAVPYSKAVSIDNDYFYSLLLKNKYIKFNRKLGYTAFTPKLKPFLFKEADRTYIRMGTFLIKIINLKFISRKLSEASFSFIFKPNILYRIAKKII